MIYACCMDCSIITLINEPGGGKYAGQKPVDTHHHHHLPNTCEGVKKESLRGKKCNIILLTFHYTCV